jgi:hypothetical protein
MGLRQLVHSSNWDCDEEMSHPAYAFARWELNGLKTQTWQLDAGHWG